MEKIIWTNEKRNINDLIPADYNPRQLTEKQAKELNTSLSRFELADPIIINKDNKIIGGHQRINILKTKGVQEVDVRLPSRQLTEKEEKELNLRLNKNLGEWDFDALANFEQDLLLDVGFESAELDNIFQVESSEKDDVVPEVRETDIKQGDIFILGKHRLMCGDSTKVEDVEKLMDGNKADMVFTDPPYNVDYQGSAGKIKNDKFKKRVEFYQFLFDAIGALRPFVAGDVYIAMSSSELDNLQKAFRDNNGHWSTFIIWVKNSFTLGRSNYQRQYEPILYGWFEGSSHYWSGKRNLGDVIKEEIREEIDGTKWIRIENENIEGDIWEFDKPKKNKLHPTMKPVALINRAILNSSIINNIVLDTFLGSGSTLIACEKTNRICYGMELDPVYCQVIVDRWEEFTGQKAVKAGGEQANG